MEEQIVVVVETHDPDWPTPMRRELADGDYVLVEKEEGEWPEWAVFALARVIQDQRRPWSYLDLLDALAEARQRG